MNLEKVVEPERTSAGMPQVVGIRTAAGLGLFAGLHLQYCRARATESLQWAAVASLPVWLEVSWGRLPEVLARLGLVIECACLARAVTFAILAARWQRRTLQLKDDSASVAFRLVWTSWDELRAALWFGLGLVSLAPALYLVFNRPLPPPLLTGLAASALTILVLLGGVSALSALRPSEGMDEALAPAPLPGSASVVADSPAAVETWQEKIPSVAGRRTRDHRHCS